MYKLIQPPPVSDRPADLLFRILFFLTCFRHQLTFPHVTRMWEYYNSHWTFVAVHHKEVWDQGEQCDKWLRGKGRYVLVYCGNNEKLGTRCSGRWGDQVTETGRNSISEQVGNGASLKWQKNEQESPQDTLFWRKYMSIISQRPVTQFVFTKYIKKKVLQFFLNRLKCSPVMSPRWAGFYALWMLECQGEGLWDGNREEDNTGELESEDVGVEGAQLDRWKQKC